MKIVFPDAKSVGSDIDLSGFSQLGEFVRYDYLSASEMAEAAADADVLLVNKLPVNAQTIGDAKHLKLVCVTATGTNNLDKEYLKSRGIEWRNVAGYSTETVAQHTFALFFYLFEKLSYYDAYVKEGRYVNDEMFTHFGRTFHDLCGKTWGIVGLGSIGSRVAQIASCFGAHVIYYSTSGKNHNPDYEEVSFDELLSRSDIVSIHAPLNEQTLDLFDASAFARMKNTALLINVGRGPIIVEEDLAQALATDQIAGAALDVLREEPMRPGHPLLPFTDSTRLLITPHIAWASIEARTRLMELVLKQIQEFYEA